MAVTDDAFELIRDLDALKRLALDSGNIELQTLAVSISQRAGQLSRRLTELLEEKEVIDSENKSYTMQKKTSNPQVGAMRALPPLPQAGNTLGPAQGVYKPKNP